MPAVSSVSAPAPIAPAPGKSALAPGQQAKAAIAAARGAGVDLPKNAQGFAASQIARGAEAASLFAAQIAALTPEPVSPGEIPDAAPAQQEPVSDAIAAYAFNAPAVSSEALATD